MGGTDILLVKLLFCIGLFWFAGMLAVVSYPLITRSVGMNHWYGIRFPQAFYSEESWFAINAYGGRMFILWAAFIAVAGILLFLVPTDNTMLLLGAYLSVLASLVIPIGITYAYASHFRRQGES